MTDWDFYLNVYHGSAIPFEDWSYCELRAAAQLERYKRIYTVTTPEGKPDSEDMAVCAMAEAMYGFDLLASGEGGPVRSTSIGSVSVSYAGTAAQSMDLSPQRQARELYRTACRYLDIYRGVR